MSISVALELSGGPVSIRQKGYLDVISRVCADITLARCFSLRALPAWIVITPWLAHAPKLGRRWREKFIGSNMLGNIYIWLYMICNSGVNTGHQTFKYTTTFFPSNPRNARCIRVSFSHKYCMKSSVVATGWPFKSRLSGNSFENTQQGMTANDLPSFSAVSTIGSVAWSACKPIKSAELSMISAWSLRNASSRYVVMYTGSLSNGHSSDTGVVLAGSSPRTILFVNLRIRPTQWRGFRRNSGSTTVHGTLYPWLRNIETSPLPPAISNRPFPFCKTSSPYVCWIHCANTMARCACDFLDVWGSSGLWVVIFRAASRSSIHCFRAS